MLSESNNKVDNSPDKLTSTISEKNLSQNKTKIESISFSPSKDQESAMNYPSLSQYINPQRLAPYNEMLKKNIRSFNILQNPIKKEEPNTISLKDKINIDVPVIEMNFKFTCDYELIETEMKEFLELFGEIGSLDYNMNSNSLKIIYKYYMASMYANFYLNYLIYGNKKRKNRYENYLFVSQVDEDKSSHTEEKKKNSGLNEKQSEDILKFIKFLTENYKNEPKIKSHDTPVKSVENKYINNLDKIFGDNDDRKEEINCDNNILNSSNEKNPINCEKKIYSNNINNPKNLFLQQNSVTPVKKSNAFNNYSASNIISSNKKSNPISNSSAAPLRPFNTSLKPPLLCMPFFPNFNMKFGIPIPIFFPINSSFIKKPINKKSVVNINKEEKSEKTINSSLEFKQPEENKINSCLMDNQSNNPINILNKKDNQNIKEFLDNNGHKTANISNNSNNSTSSKEKNIINENNMNESEINSNDKSKNDSDSNKIMSNKSDSTIKTEEVNKSNNATDELKRIIDIKIFEDSDNKPKNNNINGSDVKSNNNSSSGRNSDFMSSFRGKTLSLERLNNYLQANQPVSNFINPIRCLNPQHIDKDKEKEEKKINIDNKKEKEAFAPKNMDPINNYFNPIHNFYFMPNLMHNNKKDNSSQTPNKTKSNRIPIYPPIPFPYLVPPFFYKKNPKNFNKDVIDFNKLTLETKNKVHFMTHSSRYYYYKYVCNYDVQIENDNLFMVTKRIIGKNGCFLKKIIQESCIKYGDYSTKIRLRGKGSGYVDKISNVENNDEPLILSVSSLNYPTYYNCCLLVDNLMTKIYNDYYEHLQAILPKDLHPSIIKKKLVKNEFVVDRINSMPYSSYYHNNMNDKENYSNSFGENISNNKDKDKDSQK